MNGIKTFPQPELWISEEQKARLYQEWETSLLLTAVPVSFDDFVRSKLRPILSEETSKASLAYSAMMFARKVHAGQVRKYTGNPYIDHLAEVAGLVATVSPSLKESPTIDAVIAVAWLHDCVEDQGVTEQQLTSQFGANVTLGVLLLSDLETGNRFERMEASRARLAQAPGWVQTIKCADIISNTSSIIKHDPYFAKIYLDEKRSLLNAMVKADHRLLKLAYKQVYGV